MLECSLHAEKETPRRTPEQIRADIQLQIGYCLMLRERHPFNEKEKDCCSEESAYFLNLEREYLGIPPHLQYPNLESTLKEKHRPSIRKIWEELVLKRSEFEDTFKGLQSHWNHTPWLAAERFGEKGRSVNKAINEYPQKIPAHQKGGIIHTVTPAFNKLGNTSRLSRWKLNERCVRGKFYTDHRDYMSTLRLYYELLLEEKQDFQHKTKEAVIPPTNPLRTEIAHRNYMARVINTAYQCIQMAKAAHHEQPKGRIRKYEGIPYTMHTLKVTFAALMDVLPFIDTSKEQSIDPLLLAAVGPIHDTVEDTTFTLRGIMNLVENRADVYDTSIDPKITLNFQEKGSVEEVEAVEEFKIRKVNLIKRPHIIRTIEAILRILTDSIPGDESENKAALNDNEIKTAIEQNLFGEEQTLFHLGLLSKKDLDLDELAKQQKIKKIKARYGIKQQRLVPCQTAKSYPDDHDNGKLTRFLIRANAIATRGGKDGKKRRDPSQANRIIQHALILKFNDRSNNLLTKPSETEKQVTSKLKDLRNAVERLISWAIHDYDNQNYPLYNSLPRLIHTCLSSYEELIQTHPEKIEEIDRKYIKDLETWAKGEIEITRFQTSAEVEAIMEKYAEDKKDDPRKLRGTTYQFTREKQAA